jgi:microcystin-dependent protein
MALPFIGEIRLIASDVVPPGWASCDGQTLSKNDNPTLFGWLGGKFGGDGADRFGLPDLRGRSPLQLAPGHPLAQAGGQEAVALTVGQLPAHTHALRASDTDGNRAAPEGSVWARSEALGFSADAPDASMGVGALAEAGSGQSHENLMPFLGVRSILALDGRSPDDPALEDYYVGEIRIMAFEQVPAGWARCDGQLLSANDYPTLYAYIGNTFGGSGEMFALPNLTGRIPIHRGPGHPLTVAGGEEAHVLTLDQMPSHSHAARCAGVPGDDPSPSGRAWGVQSAALAYSDDTPGVSLSAAAVSSKGSGVAHDNMPPFLTLHFCIALDGEGTSNEAPATQPFAGEIRMFPYDFAPPFGWAFCDGGVLNVADNSGLFRMIGAAYGGDGHTTYGLPDLQGRAPMHPGRGPGLSARALGDAGGVQAVTLTAAHMPAHNHDVRVRTAVGTAGAPAGNVFAAASARALSAGYASQPPTASMSPMAVGATEGGVAHNNMAPYLPISFCISLNGEAI